MDVFLTSGPASPLHIVATCGAEALLPTLSPPQSLIITYLTVVLALCDNFFQKSFIVNEQRSHLALLTLSFCYPCLPCFQGPLSSALGMLLMLVVGVVGN